MAVGRQKKIGKPANGPRRRAFIAYRLLPTAYSSGGWTLIELVITMTIMAILSVGIIPLVKTAVKRQREYQLRESLRTMREAIKEFHRDTVGMPAAAGIGGTGLNTATQAQAGAQGGQNFDPRSRVVIADPTIFGVDNLERYPPGLDTLVSGVSVIPRGPQVGGSVGGGDLLSKESDLTKGGALGNKKKIYLREIPKDPITGKSDWCFHSPFDDPGQCSDNTDAGIFDVTSKADGTALDGTKYSEW